MKKVFKWGAIIFVGFIVLGVIAGSGSDKKTTDTKNEVTQSAKVQPTPIKVEVNALGDAFDKNQVAAEKEWRGKLVEFSAKVSNITDSGVSFHDVATKEYSGTQISCRVEDKDSLLPISNGETITVRGVVDDQIIGVIGINDCVIVK